MSELRTSRGVAVALGAVLGLAAGSPLSAADVDLNLPDLPPGKKVTIKFRGEVNASLADQVLPLISNQGQVTETSLGTVLTDDPDAGGAADPTTTVLDSLSLGDRVWLDGNGNQTFDAGEGIVGVALSLFADVDDSGTLTPGDGMPIATTTTGADGLYGFTGLAPGDYIVRADASNFQSGGALETYASIPDPMGGPIDPDNNVDHDDNGADDANPAANGIASPAITLAYNAEPTPGTGNDSNPTLDLGFVEGPDIEVTKSESADPVVAGSGADNLVYTITVKNNGPLDATGVEVTDTLTLPTGVTVTNVAASAGSTSGTNPIVWDIGPLANGASVTLTVTLTVAANTVAGTDVISDTAELTAINETDSNPSNNSATESTSVAREVDLVVTKADLGDPVIAGSGAGNMTFVVTVTNNGPSDASGLTLSEDLTVPMPVTVDSVTPSAGSFAVTTAPNGTWTVGDLAAGANATLTVVLTAPASTPDGTVVSNTATVTAVDATQVSTGDESASESVTVERQVDLEVTKTESADPVIAGSGAGNLTYVVTVKNLGPSDAGGVTLSEAITVPTGVTLDSVTPSGSTTYAPPNAASGTWTVGSLAAGASETLTVVLTVSPSAADGELVSDTATVTAVDEVDTESGNDSATESTTVERQIDLTVSKTESADPVIAGSGPGNLTYVVTVTNLGPSDASGVELFEDLTLVPGTGLNSITASPGTSFTPSVGADGTWTVGDLPASASATLTVVLTVAPNAPNGGVVSDTATVTASNETRINLGDDSATESTTVVRRIDLVLTKTESADPVVAGSGAGNLTYLVTILNNGPSNATGVTVFEDLTLPAGVTVKEIKALGNGPTFTPTVPPDGTWTVGNLGVGGSRFLMVTLTVGPSTFAGVDVIGNTATVSGSNETRINTGDDSVTVTTSVTRIVDFLVSKTDNPDPVVAGAGSGALTYTTEVGNLGPSDATGVTIDDTVILPAGVTVESVTPSSGVFVDPTWTVDIPADSSVFLTMVLAVDSSAVEGTDVISNTATVTGIAPGHTVINPGDDSDTETTSIVSRRDFGDAPDPSYPTRLASDGARHVLLPGGPLLGFIVDDETDGQPTPNADGDDLSLGRPDDEDGVVFSAPVVAGTSVGVSVTASAASLLNAWVDFNGDGDWADAGEQVFTDEPLAAGVNALSVDVPSGAKAGATFSRFRVSTAGGLTFTGEAADGEVEDHKLEITRVSDVEVTKSDLYEPVMAGKLQVYTAVVTNHGPSDALVTLEDTLPAGVFFVYAEPLEPACMESGGVVTCDLGEIAVGESSKVHVAVLVPPTASGALLNTARVSTSSDDPEGDNDSATAQTVIVGLHDLASLADLNGNGSSEIVVLQGGSLIAEVRDGATGNLVSSMTFGADGFLPIGVVVLDDAGGSPAPDLGFLSYRKADGIVKIVRRDSLTGQWLGVIPVANGDLVPLYVARVPHFDPLIKDGVATLGMRSDGAFVARVRDAVTGAFVSSTGFARGIFPTVFGVSTDFSGNNVPELVATGVRASDGAVRGISRDALTGGLVQRLPFRGEWLPVAGAIVADFTGDGVTEQAVLALRLADLLLVAQVRNPVSGAMASSFPVGNKVIPYDLLVVDDFAGTPASELTTIFVNGMGTPVIRTRDAATGSLLFNQGLQDIFRPLDAVVVPNYGATPAQEIGVLLRRAADGVRLIKVKDAASGQSTIVSQPNIPVL